MHLFSLRQQCIALLEKSDIPKPFYEVDLIFSDILAIDRAKLHSDRTREITEKEALQILDLIRRRAEHVPMAQLLRCSYFYGRKFIVDDHCLAPRPETEVLVRSILERLPQPSLYFADWCTGSGCIGLSLLAERGGWRGIGVDSSALALSVAWQNSRAFGAHSRFLLWHSADPHMAPLQEGQLDFIVANPPYIATADLPYLMPEVRDHEPRVALDGGADGLDFYRLFLNAFPRWLTVGGLIFFETGGPEQVSVMERWCLPKMSFEYSFFDDFEVNRFMVWRRIA